MTKFFNEVIKFNDAYNVNPDEVVVHGAAIQATILSGKGGSQIERLLLLDVSPMTIGLDVDGVM